MAANIVNGGAIILVAVFGLVAIVGAADELRAIAGPASGRAEPDAASREAGPFGDPDVETPILGKHGLGDDRDDKRGHGERGSDRNDDRHRDDEDDEGDGHDEDDEDDD